MATELHEGHELEREIHVHGIERAVIVTLSSTGISMRLKGTQQQLHQGWVQIVEHMNMPTNVPSYLMGKPYEFFKKTAEKLQGKKEKRADG
jgi:hypothetical protein